MTDDPRDQGHRGHRLLPLEQAARLLLAEVRPLSGEEFLPLAQAVGRVLARPVALDRPEPPVPRSAMDGYAVRSGDGADPRRLRGAVHAGTPGRAEVGAGEAVAVMTGGTVPAGADAVVPVERARLDGELLRLDEPPEPGRHVRAAGEMGPTGRVLLEPGRRLRPEDLAAAAGCGLDPIPVRPRPRCAVLSTGDEVVPWTERPEPHQVRDGNRLASILQLARAGGEVVLDRHLPDRPEDLRAAAAEALAGGIDLLITIGGVSMGEKDHLPEVFADLGVERLFHGVSVQPGKPVWAGRRGPALVLGLPGNPLSSFVILELLAAPVLRRLGGETGVPELPVFEAGRCLGEAAAKKRPRFLTASLEPSAAGLPGVRPRPQQGSGDWTALAEADALLALPPGARVRPGDPVEFLRLG
ncbi:MAG: molybdopterin molybdenumtransferase MoeA [Planctomycetota bacterium]|nr:MAG: molybdopterin molybdenumtransferase MoeA [Planctomycetota bacterium]